MSDVLICFGIVALSGLIGVLAGVIQLKVNAKRKKKPYPSAVVQ